MHVDVVAHGGVESRNPEAHESELDDRVGRRVEAPLEVIEQHRHLSLRCGAVLGSSANRWNSVGSRAPRTEARVALAEDLEAAPVVSHAADDDASEHIPEHLDQRQRPVVAEAAVGAALVHIVGQVNVPAAGRHLCVLDGIEQHDSPLPAPETSRPPRSADDDGDLDINPPTPCQ